jgi:hypothetical protein
MSTITRQQRVALKAVYDRHILGGFNSDFRPYRAFRRTVQPGPDCIMVQVPGVWLGIETDGYTHS